MGRQSLARGGSFLKFGSCDSLINSLSEDRNSPNPHGTWNCISDSLEIGIDPPLVVAAGRQWWCPILKEPTFGVVNRDLRVCLTLTKLFAIAKGHHFVVILLWLCIWAREDESLTRQMNASRKRQFRGQTTSCIHQVGYEPN